MSKATQENIRKLLAITGATHQQLADIAHVDRSAVSHWKSGKAEPRMGHLQRIADHYGIKVSNLADTRGMEFVRKNRDGRLYEDVNAKTAALRKEIMNIRVSMPEHSAYQLVDSYTRAEADSREIYKLDDEELELIYMFRSMNEVGRSMALAAIAAFAKSGDYSK